MPGSGISPILQGISSRWGRMVTQALAYSGFSSWAFVWALNITSAFVLPVESGFSWVVMSIRKALWGLGRLPHFCFHQRFNKWMWKQTNRVQVKYSFPGTPLCRGLSQKGDTALHKLLFPVVLADTLGRLRRGTISLLQNTNDRETDLVFILLVVNFHHFIELL